jgi:hypothetical protein
VYLAKGGKVYRYGNAEEPLYADKINEYNKTWTVSTAYVVGDLVYDTDIQRTFECLIANTSAASGTFEQDRDLVAGNWTEYVGIPINWALETPWSDLSKRGVNKTVKYVGHDTEGSDSFTFSLFSNQFYRNRDDYQLIPNRSMEFNAGDYAGFGTKNALKFASGRRTREEKLWPMPVKGKLIKMRYEGSTVRSIRIIGTTLHYLLGGAR